ncbi:putative alkaline phosphatase-like protein [Eutypa lata UCREL1]|uniref:Putative alkaline phosphatase-like protein n=1 Tax=Eutypa lata (strain UCR-EL1) TaxID=1287681 RepID=M7TX50_EUTLA|nr:putative alkaline phosphatase-like protein [Eutypa lata UCREL1]
MHTRLAKILCLVATTAVSVVSASFHGNLNFASPSRRDAHANLGVDVPRVVANAKRRKRSSNGGTPPRNLTFTHGVASGDPYADSVILWTRAAPSTASDRSNATVEGTAALYSHETNAYIKADPDPVCVQWSVFEPSGGGDTAASGEAYTTSDIDFTVKVEATGLKPFTTYNYQFKICGTNTTSPLGRTKTAPTADDDVSDIKLAVFSCSNYPNGYFNAYGNAARKDEHDYVVHLGDYIYEYEAGGERASAPPTEIFSLSDPDLQLLHQNFPWITTWDDHEVSNNGYRDGSSGLNNTEESFRNDGPGISVDQRKMNAVRAYFEWIPIRQVDLDDNLRVWRSFQLGSLMDLIILDTRNYDRSITSLGWNDDYIDLIRDDAGRTLMGSHQENWFYNQLTKSSARGATWRVIGNQIIFSSITESYGLSGDNWNGYIANRNRTLKHIYDNEISNTIFLAGDSHQNWVSDLVWLGEKPYDPTTGEGAVGVELAGTAVSSSGVTGTIAYAHQQAQDRVGNATELLWNDGYYRGYFLLEAGADRLDARFYGSPSVASRHAWELPLANFTVLAGANKIRRPIAGGTAGAGYLKDGETKANNVSLNTDTGAWDVVGFEVMYLNTSVAAH